MCSREITNHLINRLEQKKRKIRLEIRDLHCLPIFYLVFIQVYSDTCRCEQCDRADCQFDVDRRCILNASTCLFFTAVAWYV